MIPDRQKTDTQELDMRQEGIFRGCPLSMMLTETPFMRIHSGIPSWRKNGKGNGEQHHYKEQVLPQIYAQEDGIVDWFDAIRIHYNKH